MSVSTIGVIGAGVMGSGIAQVAATKGINVILLDVNDKAVKTGIDAVESRSVGWSPRARCAEKEAAARRIKGTTTYDGVKPADVSSKPRPENYDLKTKIFKQVDERRDIVASNTSSVSITKLACSMSHPKRFVSLHERTDRMIATELHSLVDVLGARIPLGKPEEGFIDHRQQNAIDDEPRRAFDCDGRFAELHVAAASWVASLVSNPRTISTSDMTGTGLKKWP
jgi:hypothetical protein